MIEATTLILAVGYGFAGNYTLACVFTTLCHLALRIRYMDGDPR